MNISLEGIQVSNALVLAIMATLGYVFVTLRDRRAAATTALLWQAQQDVGRAQMTVKELEKAVSAIHASASKHYARLKGFERRVARLNSRDKDTLWQELCREIETILDPTLQLVNEITSTQERIRYQSNYLMSFSASRSDPLTKLGNRRALDYVASTQFALLKRCNTPFSLAILDIDHFKVMNDQHGHQHGDEVLRDLAALLTGSSRAVDIVTRYGGDELVVIMPQTGIVEAGRVADRLRAEVEEKMTFTVSVGVASANDADTPDSLFRRADAALYRAKSNGRNRTFLDRGETIAALPPEVVTDVDLAVPGPLPDAPLGSLA